jgi:23S rRNA (adenine2030-N6)-methyltransferase
MNYHHIYHAGNFADVFKHIILTLCLEKFHEKTAPFFALDTHGGIGKYDLSDEKSVKTFEADEGIKKLLKEKNFADFLPERYLWILAKINNCEISELPDKLKTYAGSPILIKDYLRREDRAIFAELNREDFFQLRKSFAGNPKFSLFNEDGFQLIKSKLPPLEKRGLIIIDPAFEKDQSKISADYEKIIFGLQDAYKRFAHGVYLIWYPIIKSDKEVLEKFYREMSELKFAKIMQATFDIGSKEGETKMHSCGMFIINAPWQLDEKLNVILPQILKVLKKNDEAKFEIKIIK